MNNSDWVCLWTKPVYICLVLPAPSGGAGRPKCLGDAVCLNVGSLLIDVSSCFQPKYCTKEVPRSGFFLERDVWKCYINI